MSAATIDIRARVGQEFDYWMERLRNLDANANKRNEVSDMATAASSLTSVSLFLQHYETLASQRR